MLYMLFGPFLFFIEYISVNDEKQTLVHPDISIIKKVMTDLRVEKKDFSEGISGHFNRFHKFTVFGWGYFIILSSFTKF